MPFDFFGSSKKDEKHSELEENIDKIRKKVQQQEIEQQGMPTPRDNVGQQRPSNTREDFEAPQAKEESKSQDARSEPRSQQEPEQQKARGQEQARQRKPQRTDTQENTDDSRQRTRSQNSGETRPPRQPPEPERKPPAPARNAEQKEDPLQDGAGERSQRSLSGRQPAQSRDIAQQVQSGNQQDQTEPEPDTTDDADEPKLSREEVPEPPEVKDLDIPDIQKGPLFITVNKFKNALNTLETMKQVANDMEAQVGALENTLEEDRETEQKLRQLLDGTIEDTEVIEEIVSPSSDD